MKIINLFYLIYQDLEFTSLKKYFNYRDLDKIVNFMRADKKNISKKINFITLKK